MGMLSLFQCHLQHCPCEQAGGIEHRQRAVSRVDKERDISAAEDDSIAAPLPQVFNHRIEINAGLFGEYPVHQLTEDDGVNPITLLLVRNITGDTERFKPSGIDRPLYQVFRSRNPKPGIPLYLCLRSDGICDVYPRDG